MMEKTKLELIIEYFRLAKKKELTNEERSRAEVIRTGLCLTHEQVLDEAQKIVRQHIEDEPPQ